MKTSCWKFLNSFETIVCENFFYSWFGQKDKWQKNKLQKVDSPSWFQHPPPALRVSWSASGFRIPLSSWKLLDPPLGLVSPPTLKTSWSTPGFGIPSHPENSLICLWVCHPPLTLRNPWSTLGFGIPLPPWKLLDPPLGLSSPSHPEKSLIHPGFGIPLPPWKLLYDVRSRDLDRNRLKICFGRNMDLVKVITNTWWLIIDYWSDNLQ